MKKCNTQTNYMATTANNWQTPGATSPGRYNYLVEDNARDDFCLSSEMDGTHGKSTFEDDLGQQLLRRAAHGKLA